MPFSQLRNNYCIMHIIIIGGSATEEAARLIIKKRQNRFGELTNRGMLSSISHVGSNHPLNYTYSYSLLTLWLHGQSLVHHGKKSCTTWRGL